MPRPGVRRNGRCSSPPCRRRVASGGSATVVVLVSSGHVPAGRAIRPGEAGRGLGFHPELPVGVAGQRPDHRGAAVRAVRHPWLARSPGARGGYLFTALMAVPHALSFPRLFAPDGLIGAGPQTTAWLYMIWHAGFPLAVIGYALLRDREGACGVLAGRPGARCVLVLAVGLWRGPARHVGPRPAAGHHARRRLHADAAYRHRRRLVAEPGGAAHPLEAARHSRCSMSG